RHRLGGLRARGVRGAAAPRRDGNRGRRGPGTRLRPRHLRRAALDPHDHRAAIRGPGGDPRMSATSARTDAATATMISLVSSLADNKSALGRRFGEWAVSAPTIEAAVAAPVSD